jgi:hypothetical protein
VWSTAALQEKPKPVLRLEFVGPLAPGDQPSDIPGTTFVKWLDEDETAKFRLALFQVSPSEHAVPAAAEMLFASAENAYKAGRHPWFAWAAYAYYRQAGLPLPEWVLAYFDEVAVNIQLCIHRKAAGRVSDWRRAVAEAVGFKSRPGAGDMLSELLNSTEMEVGKEVEELKAQFGGKLKEARRSVSERRSIPETTVARYHKKYLLRQEASQDG